MKQDDGQDSNSVPIDLTRFESPDELGRALSRQLDGLASKDRRRLLRLGSMGGMGLFLAGCASSKVSDPNPVRPAGAADLQAWSDFSEVQKIEYCNQHDDTDECAVPSETEFAKAIEYLSEGFFEGTKVQGMTVELAPGVRESRIGYHARFIGENWCKWNRCKRLTRECAFSTGAVAALLATDSRRALSEQAVKNGHPPVPAETPIQITNEHFIAAANVVGSLQKARAGKLEDVAIACG